MQCLSAARLCISRQDESMPLLACSIECSWRQTRTRSSHRKLTLQQTTSNRMEVRKLLAYCCTAHPSSRTKNFPVTNVALCRQDTLETCYMNRVKHIYGSSSTSGLRQYRNIQLEMAHIELNLLVNCLLMITYSLLLAIKRN